jgi:hypothetical protein
MLKVPALDAACAQISTAPSNEGKAAVTIVRLALNNMGSTLGLSVNWQKKRHVRLAVARSQADQPAAGITKRIDMC